MNVTELTAAKIEAHEAFDVLWKSGAMTRDAAYALLSTRMNIPPEECHIAKFTLEQCKRVVELCKPYAVISSSGVRVSDRKVWARLP